MLGLDPQIGAHSMLERAQPCTTVDGHSGFLSFPSGATDPSQGVCVQLPTLQPVGSGAPPFGGTQAVTCWGFPGDPTPCLSAGIPVRTLTLVGLGLAVWYLFFRGGPNA